MKIWQQALTQKMKPLISPILKISSRLRHGCKRQDVSGQEDIGTAREGSRSRAASQRQGDGAGGAPSIAGGEAGCG